MCKNGMHDVNVEIMAFSETYKVSVSVFLYLKAKSLIHYVLWVVAERNMSVVFSDELDNGHYDVLLPVEEKWG